jgi:hypothetical protein
MGLAEAVWRTNAKFGTAIFLTTCSYGFFYTVVNHSSPVDDARAWWTGELCGFWGQLGCICGTEHGLLRHVAFTSDQSQALLVPGQALKIAAQAVALFASSVHVQSAAGSCGPPNKVCTN